MKLGWRGGGDATLEIDRLSFITDGVYAIVFTLLVLELRIPDGLAPDRILPAIVAAAPRFAAFAIAFSAAAIGWTFTYLSHSVLRRSNITHLVLTLLSLMFVSLMPFASAMMGEYPDSPWGYLPYCFVIGGLCAVYTVDLLLCGRNLAHDNVDGRIIRMFWLSTGGCMLVAIGGVPLAFISPRAMLWVIMVVSAIIWVDYVYLSRAVARALAAKGQAEAASAEATSVLAKSSPT